MSHIHKLLITALLFSGFISEAKAEIYITSMPFEMLKKDEAVTLKWIGATGSCELRYRPTPSATHSPDDYTPLAPPKNGTGALTFTPQDHGMTGGAYYCIIKEIGKDNISQEFPLCIESTGAASKRAPAKGSTIETSAPVFQWDRVIGVPYYCVVVFDRPIKIDLDKEEITTEDGSPVTPIYQAITSDNSIAYGTPDPSGYFLNTSGEALMPGATYPWLVLNCYASNPAFISPAAVELPWEFTYSQPTKLPEVILDAPANSKTTERTERYLTFEWHTADCNTCDPVANYHIYLYQVEEEDGNEIALLVWDASTSNTFYDINAENLLTESLYTWKVVAEDKQGKGVVSKTRYFRYRPPQVVSLGKLKIQARYDNKNTEKTEAVPLANVDIQDENQRSINPYPLSTNSNGELTIDLNPGTYWAVVSKSGFEPGKSSGTVVSNTTKILTVTLTKSEAYIRGKVLDGKGSGLSGALVKISQKESPFEEKKTFTAGDGSYVFSVEMGTSWDLSVSKVGYDLSGVEVRVEKENTTVNDINIAKNENIISGTVINEDGYLIQNALVKVKKDVEWPVSTSDDGSFMFKVDNGTWILSVSKDGFVSPAPVTIEATGGQVITRQLILTSKAGRVTGEVSSKNGLVPKAIVEAYTLGGIKKGEAETDNNGQYSLTLPWGMLNLRAKKDGYTSGGDQQISLKAEETRSGVNFTLTANKSHIKGKITTDGTTPLSGAKVTNGLVVTTTNDSGSYDLMVSEGSFSIDASKEGCLSSGAKQVTIGIEEVIEPVDFVLSPNASVIKGRVSSKEGPVYEAIVTSTSGDGQDTTTTDENGQYIFSLAGGTRTVKATKEGFTEDELTVSLAPGQTARDQNLVIEENIGYVKGKVTGDTSAIRNVNLRIEQGGEEVLSGVTDPKAGYFFALTPGDYEIFASRTGYNVSPTGQTFTVVRSDTPTEVRDFTLAQHAYTISGIVLGKEEEVIRDAKVTVDGIEKRTGDDGRYEVGVEPGIYTVKIEKTGYKLESKTVTIEQGSTETVRIVDFELERNYAALEGRVTSEGVGLGGVQVDANGKPATTLADGSYSYSELSPGNYTITATKEGYEEKAENRDLEGGKTTVCNFELISAIHSVRGTVVDTGTGRGIPEASISIEKGSVKKTGATDANGDYLISNLSNGEYTISVVKKGYALLTGPEAFTIADTDAQVDFTLEILDKIITVEVKDEEGNVVSDAGVVADGEADVDKYHGTGIYQAGNYVIGELKAGKYTVTATKGGYSGASKEGVATGATQSLQITKIVGSIQGRVVDEKDSSPIAGTRVTIRGSETDTSTYTDIQGDYLFPDLVPGIYTLEVEKEYYISRPRQQEVEITGSGQKTAEDFLLAYSPIASLILGAREKFVSGTGESYQLSLSVQDEKGQNITAYPSPEWKCQQIAGSVTDGKYTPNTGYFGEVGIAAEIDNVEDEEIFKVFHRFESGREITLKDNENLELAILAKAEKDPAITEDEISIEKSEVSPVRAAIGEQRVVGKIFNLLPDGFRFTDKDVVLRLPIPSGVDRNLSIGRWNKDKLRWEDLGGTVFGDRIEVAIDHFSEYVILTRAKKLGMEGLKIQPNPFSPKKKAVIFSYSLDTESASKVGITIKIYTITGDLIKTIRNNDQQRVGEEQEESWDGTDSDGQECLNGRYLVQFILDDGKDKKEMIKSVVLIK